MEYLPWVLFGVAAVFLGIELVTTNLVFVMLAAGAVAAGITNFLGSPLWSTFLLGFAVAALGLTALRPPLLARLNSKPELVTGVDTIIGEPGITVTPVTAAHGIVFVRGEQWSARPADGDPIPTNTPVTVTNVDGAYAIITTRPAPNIAQTPATPPPVTHTPEGLT